LENSSRFFLLDSESGRHTLALPQPFVIAPRWTPKKFLPFFASCNHPSTLRFFFTLFDSERYKQVAALYLSAPNWTSSQHPYFQEPSEHEELGHLVRDLYGLETLFRISLISHPCKEPLIFLYLATDRVLLTTPILQSSHRFQLDELVASAFRPFYAEGKGKVMCSLCLFRISEDQFTPVFLSRSEFCQHYREYHFQNSIVSGLFSSTQYHVRQYQAHCLWTLCLPHRDFRDGNQDSSPVDVDAMSSFNLGISHHLAIFVPGARASHQPPNTDKPPSSVSFGLPEDVLAEMVDLQDVFSQCPQSKSGPSKSGPESSQPSQSSFKSNPPCLPISDGVPEDPFPPLAPRTKPLSKPDPRKKK
jgi:hypothetical protein